MILESDMAFIFLLMLSGVAAVAAVIVFLCALPFLLKSRRGDNRFGAPSKTQGMGTAIVSGLRRGLDFAGRSNPMDFWFFAIFVLMLCGLSLVGTIGLVFVNSVHPTAWSALPLIVIPVMAMPSLAVAVRRLHDINLSGWWLLLLGCFGYFVLLYWFFQPTQTDSTAEIF